MPCLFHLNTTSSDGDLKKSFTYTRSVSEGGVERMCVWIKQVLDVCEALDLELLRLFFYDLSNKRNNTLQAFASDPLLMLELKEKNHHITLAWISRLRLRARRRAAAQKLSTHTDSQTLRCVPGKSERD